MRYRVEQLAASCDVSVDTVRFYQSRGLLPQPEREGRVAWYGDDHAERIRRIRALQTKGLTLAAIGRVLDGEVAADDADLAAAVAVARGDDGQAATLTLDELASASGVPASLIQAVEREGIAVGRRVDGQVRYSTADVEVVRTALRLLEFGLPVGDLLSLARDADEALRTLAVRAVDLFDAHVREPIRDTVGAEPGGARTAEAFEALLPAVTSLIANHFRRVVIEEAERRLEP
ncbi:MAG TPA: MerR family transcriptional regulator [Actinomycetota bacterium]|jgi:DNA-binding transcriptional MerR regulator|nr:MerR family transcriptional regulator [Actinomycetota bacterium]